jgi:hypothetical protein
MSGSVVVDELSTSGGNVSWVSGSCNGCDVGVVVSAGRVGTDSGTVGSGSGGTVVDVSSIVVDVVDSGSGATVVVVVSGTNTTTGSLVVVV